MSRSYFTEDAKMFKAPVTRWTLDECYQIRTILESKGYDINCVSRIGCDRKYHEAWQVQREDVPKLVEQCFRQRLVIEVQAEGTYKAAITFVYDYAAETIIAAAGRFQRNREDSL